MTGQGLERSIEARQSQAIDAAKIVRIDRLALAIDDDPAGVGQPDGGVANLRKMRAPTQSVLAARGGESLGGVGRADRAPEAAPLHKWRIAPSRLGGELAFSGVIGG